MRWRDPKAAEPAVRLVATVTGQVQAVGFRAWTYRVAAELGLAGTVENLADGSVRIVAEGPRRAADALLDRLRSGRTAGRVSGVEASFLPASHEFTGFDIR